MNKRLALVILSVSGILFLFSGVSASAAEISPELRTFKDGAVLLVEGIADHNRSSLTDAAELLSGIDSNEFDDFETTESAPGILSNPEIIFNARFCNEVRKNNFSLVKLNPLEGLRNLDSEISTVTRSLSPGSYATFTMEGIDEMGMVAVGQYPESIKVTLEYMGTEIPIVKDSSNYSYQVGWTMCEGSPEFKVTVENISDRPVTFVLGIQ